MRLAAISLAVFVAVSAAAWGDPLSVEDFTFAGPLGSEGTTIEPVGENHFRVKLGHAPNQPGWNNKLQFTLRNAKGKPLRLDVVFETGPEYSLNEYFHSWSYDGTNWNPVQWQLGYKKSPQSDTLVFPTFQEDTVFVGHQVPMSYEQLQQMVEAWENNDSVRVTVLGQSLGGREIVRITVTDAASQVPPTERWTHYVTNQHPGEHNAQWRIAGMINWLLGEEGREARRRSICHFVPIMSPDAPSKGWYRVNAQGVDMNRSFSISGPDPVNQAHEAFIVQTDLEVLMQSDCRPTTLWNMHTWSGNVDPRIMPGPEMENPPGSWERFRNIIEKNDTADLIRPITLWKAEKDSSDRWTEGAHQRYGVTSVLCEGGAILYTQEENLRAGAILMKSIDEYYGHPRK